MIMSYIISPLFSSNTDGFISKLNLSKDQKSTISEAKVEIISFLRSRIAEEMKISHDITITPRFMSQGSYVYKTRNKPCKTPPQQIDHDLGCYLPLSIVKETGRPSVAAEIFFGIVDKLLAELVVSKKWKGIDTKKKTCSRVIVDDLIHIDVPLYAIPDNEYHTIMDSIRNNAVYKAFNMESDDWALKESDRVLLAHRTEDWKSSDPRKLNIYFTTVFEVKGEQLRRICRYLKAWRDNMWKEGGPSSIYLMILADKIFKSNPQRDDLSLLEILEHIPTILQNPITNPTDSTEIIRISDSDRDLLKKFSKIFYTDLYKAIHTSRSSNESCELIRKHLGSRFPIKSLNKKDDFEIRNKILNTPVSEPKDRRPETRGRAG
jgi:hypothetical protein